MSFIHKNSSSVWRRVTEHLLFRRRVTADVRYITNLVEKQNYLLVAIGASKSMNIVLFCFDIEYDACGIGQYTKNKTEKSL